MLDEISVRSAIEATIKQFGGLHIVVNCAGIAVAQKVLGKKGPMPLENFNKVIQVNLVGTFNVFASLLKR